MADPKLVEILRQGSKIWNDWREQHSNELFLDLSHAQLSAIDLHETDLTNVNISSADLRETYMVRTKLSGSNLSDAKLLGAILYGAQLDNADLHSADLSGSTLYYADLHSAHLDNAQLRTANLREANLSHADLIATDLSYADLSGAKMSMTYLRGATILDTIFARMDLRKVKGLVEIHHAGRSRLELHTIQLPPDGSALHFLRGCGVPDEWIDDYRARMMHPIQYHSCFISYSSKDDTLARRLHADLQAHGVRCWFAPEDLKIGDKIRDRIDEAIHLQDKLLLLLSEHALASEWVEDEVEAALEKERRQQREVLFPVRLDNTMMVANEAWAAKLRRSRHIGDFTNWIDPQAYNQAFDRLLRDLKAETKEENDG